MRNKLNEVKVAYLGKKGELTAILKSMKDVAPEDRPKVGQMVNVTRFGLLCLMSHIHTLSRLILEKKL